ncbi:MFS transporter [Pricia sp.]|uniref:MFS transporter n=1 Tax=Pricia sp. TaxID=2268138 RepID=UPI003593C1F1
MKNEISNKKALLALAMGGFGIGLTEFVIMGILPNVADSFHISIPKAGHFIAAYALGVVVGAPLLASISNKLAPHRMLFLLMIWFTVFNTLSAFSESYGVMLAMRFLSGLPHGAFFGIGAVVAGKLVGEGKSAQAIAIMFAGLTIANVIGVPIGTYLGNEYNWSLSFLMVGIIGLLTLASIFFWMPEMKPESRKADNGQDKGLKNPELWALIALTTIGTGGFFAWYSYIAPLITQVAHLSENMVSYAMILAGLGMVVGNFLGAKMAELFSPLKSVAISLTAMAAILILNSVFAFNPYLVLVLTFFIGLVSFTVATPIQMAIIKTSKGSEMLGSSMNQSAFNMGNASGAYFAGLPIAYGYGVASAGIVGALLASFGVAIAVALLVYRKYKAGSRNKVARILGS